MVGTDTGSLTISGNFPPPSNSPAPDSSADKPGVQCGTSGIFPVTGHRALLLHGVLLSPVPTLTLSNKKKGSNSQPFSQKLQGKKSNNPVQVLWGHTWCKKEAELLLSAPPPPPAFQLYHFYLLSFSGGCVLLLLAYLICAFVFVSFYQKYRPAKKCLLYFHVVHHQMVNHQNN